MRDGVMTDGAVVDVTDATFAEVVERAGLPVLVDFTAEWCAPCRVLEPVLEALARERAGSLRVARLDVDVNQGTSERFGVRSMPTLLLFRGGRVVQQVVGAVSRARLEKLLEAAGEVGAGAR
ncbi:MAG: thioredoxin [Anaeromyxobacteraceae bacterium]